MLIVIITNQGLIDAKLAKLRDRDGKLTRVLRAVRRASPLSHRSRLSIESQFDVPALLFAATGYDWFRKPLPGMVERLEALHGPIDREQSFYVGDAAGRIGQAPNGKEFWDHSDSD